MNAKNPPDGEIAVHSLTYSRADLDKVPAEERFFYLMAGSVANDTAILNKALLASFKNPDFGSEIANQGNSTASVFILRMLSGRLVEGAKLIRGSSKMLRDKYEDDLPLEAKTGLRDIQKYFGSKRSLLLNVRDRMAFHHLKDYIEVAYQSLNRSHELGDYIHTTSGNTLYYTAEILHYETLRHLSGLPHEEAIPRWIDDVIEQSKNFGNFLNGFMLVFAKRYLEHALDKLVNDAEVVPVIDFRKLALPFFTLPPKPEGDGDPRSAG